MYKGFSPEGVIIETFKDGHFPVEDSCPISATSFLEKRLTKNKNQKV